MTEPDRESRATLEREEDFHDRWAGSMDPAEVPVEESFALPSCPENRFIAASLGDVRALTVLELGAGLGEASVWFALRGAHVIATDLSGGMLRLVRRVAARHGASLETAQMDGAMLALPDSSVDIVYGANVLHHVDTDACLREVYRVLKPGGRGVFWDPVRYNPVINVYRRMAGQVRSVDEHPLGTADLRCMSAMFRTTEVQFTWFFTLLVFLKFYFVDQIHPNEERYWKKIIYDYESLRAWYQPLAVLDRLVLGIPGVRWLAWNMAVVLTK
jgi:SAM-dependent methyltransferase